MIPALAVACNETQQSTPALDPANFDTSVSPTENFYQYATGGWQKNNPLKPEFSRYGSFDVLRENNQKRLNDLFEGLDNETVLPGSVEQKISDLYKMGLDSVRLNKEGAAPVMPLVEKIRSVQDRRALVEAVAEMHSASDYPFFSASVSSDMIDSNNQILYLFQSGLGMGDRDYYVDTANAAIKEGYRAFLSRIFALAGYGDAEKAADDALSVEDALAKASWSSVELRDVQRMYNPLSTEELVRQYPDLDFSVYFRTLGISDQDKLVVGQPSYFAALDSLFKSTDLGVMKNYLAGQLLQGALGPVGGGVDPLVGLFGAHLIFQQLAQHAEGQAGLGGGAGLGDDVDGEPLALAQGDDVIQCGGADAVAAEVDLQARLQLVVVDALDGLHHSPGAQIAAADAGHNQDVGIAADLFGRSLDAGELFLIIIPGQIHPAQEVVAGAGLGLQALVGCSYLGIDGSKLILFDKRRKVLGVKRNAHDSRPPNRSFPYVSRGGQREQISAAGAGVRILSLSVPFHSHKVKAKILRIHTFLTRPRRAVL